MCYARALPPLHVINGKHRGRLCSPPVDEKRGRFCQSDGLSTGKKRRSLSALTGSFCDFSSPSVGFGYLARYIISNKRRFLLILQFTANADDIFILVDSMSRDL